MMKLVIIIFLSALSSVAFSCDLSQVHLLAKDRLNLEMKNRRVMSYEDGHTYGNAPYTHDYSYMQNSGNRVIGHLVYDAQCNLVSIREGETFLTQIK